MFLLAVFFLSSHEIDLNMYNSSISFLEIVKNPYESQFTVM